MGSFEVSLFACPFSFSGLGLFFFFGGVRVFSFLMKDYYSFSASDACICLYLHS